MVWSKPSFLNPVFGGCISLVSGFAWKAAALNVPESRLWNIYFPSFVGIDPISNQRGFKVGVLQMGAQMMTWGGGGFSKSRYVQHRTDHPRDSCT